MAQEKITNTIEKDKIRKYILGLIIFIAIIILVKILYGLAMSYNIKESLKVINNDYAAVLNTIFSLLLVLVTMIYVMLTYKQVSISRESIGLNRTYLKQLENEHKTSVNPTLIPEIVETNGTEYFDNRRQLSIKCKIQNIGDGPALRIYSKIKLEYKYVEFNDYEELFEYSYLGSLAPMKEEKLDMHFETEKIEKMIEDLSIRFAKNLSRIKIDPTQNVFPGTALTVELVYSNIHGQFFKTTFSNEILGLIAYQRKDKNKFIFWTTDNNILKDTERFNLQIISPIFHSLEVATLEDNIASNFIEKYKKLAL